VQRPYFQAQNLLVRLSWPKNLNSRTYYSSAKEDTDLGLEIFKNRIGYLKREYPILGQYF
jgi:hypothetical protein